jgi:hypothetical protein
MNVEIVINVPNVPNALNALNDLNERNQIDPYLTICISLCQ